MALPSKAELAVLEVFRNQVKDILSDDQLSDDFFLLRWLRARYLNIADAEKMLRNAIAWRKEENVDNMVIGRSVSDYFYKTLIYWLDGVDKNGRPVLTVPFGKWDVREILSAGKSSEIKTFVTEGYEKISRAIKENSKYYPPKPGYPPVTQIVAVYNWEGFVWSQLFHYEAVQSLLQVASIYESYYPETLHIVYFVNCPPAISTALTLLKPFVAAKTLGKIRCFGTDKNVWREELLKHIDEDQLRPQFGGTKQQ